MKEDVIHIVNLLREEQILADTKDLLASIKNTDNSNQALRMLDSFWQIEKFLLSVLETEPVKYHLKHLNEKAEATGLKLVTPQKLKTILNFWSIKQ